MNKEERNTFRKEMLGKLEEQWAKNNRPEDDLFYYHPSEDKIVLSHCKHPTPILAVWTISATFAPC